MGFIKPTDTITLAHGSGGKLMHRLLDEIIFPTLYEAPETFQEDQARIPFASLQTDGQSLALTTDSYVITPLTFPGGDIGKLAVHGTINDLAVGGAKPLYLTCGLILEEGLPIHILTAIMTSMRQAADVAGVHIVTGDTKVVERGSADQLFINTAGVGVIPHGIDLHAYHIRPTDVIIINDYIGSHGAAVVDARGELGLTLDIKSDCRPLNGLIESMLASSSAIRCMRDATRGGLATVLNEFAQASHTCLCVDEQSIPVEEKVKGVCELLGLDPMYLANEGLVVAVVPQDQSKTLLTAMHKHPYGKNAAIIGQVTDTPQDCVVLQSVFGGNRILDVLVGEQLPRIC